MQNTAYERGRQKRLGKIGVSETETKRKGGHYWQPDMTKAMEQKWARQYWQPLAAPSKFARYRRVTRCCLRRITYTNLCLG